MVFSMSIAISGDTEEQRRSITSATLSWSVPFTAAQYFSTEDCMPLRHTSITRGFLMRPTNAGLRLTVMFPAGVFTVLRFHVVWISLSDSTSPDSV